MKNLITKKNHFYLKDLKIIQKMMKMKIEKSKQK